MQKKKFFNFRPAFICALVLCLGIAVVKNFVFGEVFRAVIFFCVAVCVCFLPFFKQFGYFKKERIVIFCCCLVFFVLGGSSFFISYKNFTSQELGGYYYTVQAKVVKATDNDSGQSLILSKAIFDGNKKSNYKIRLYAYGNQNFDVGDVVEFYALIKDVPVNYQGKFSANNVINKIRYTANISCEKIKICAKNLTVFERANLFMRDTLKSGLDKNEFSVGYALLTGNSDLMDTEIISAYRMAGVAHVFAVSGLHIGFLATALAFIFDKLKSRKIIKAIFISIILFAYSGICSFTPSSIRASVMTTVALFLSLKGLRYDRLTAIAISAIVILAFAPANLFDAGFQLSFAVVLGITLIAPTLERWFNRVKYAPKKLSNTLAVALAAQLASMPVYLYHFKTVSLIAVFLNIAFIPAVSVIFTILFALTILGGAFAIPKIALFVPNYVLKFINFCIISVDYKIFIVHGAITVLLIFSIYSALLFLSEYLNIKTLTRAVCSILCLIFTLTGCVLYNVNEESYHKVFVCGSERLCVTLIDTSVESVLVVSYAERTYSLSKLISLKNELNISEIDCVVFLDGFALKEQEFLTKMRLAFTFSGVCCFGERDETTANIIKKSFGGDISVNFYNERERLPISGATCAYALEGRALELDLAGNDICVLSEVDGVDYSKLNGKYDLMIAKDGLEQLNGFYSPKIFVSYLKFNEYLDAESQGFLLFKYRP